jgi:hypothetical protein
MKETPNNTQSGALASVPQKEKKKNDFLYIFSRRHGFPSLFIIPFIQLQDILKSHFLSLKKKKNVPYIIVGCYIPNTEILTTQRVVDHQRR